MMAWGVSRKNMPYLFEVVWGKKLSPSTIDVISQRVFRKLGVNKNIEVVTWYHKTYRGIDLGTSPFIKYLGAFLLGLFLTTQLQTTDNMVRVRNSNRIVRVTRGQRTREEAAQWM
jgi:hypothetical protein